MRVHVEFDIEGALEMELFASFQKFVDKAREGRVMVYESDPVRPATAEEQAAFDAGTAQPTPPLGEKPKRTRKPKTGPALVSSTGVLDPATQISHQKEQTQPAAPTPAVKTEEDKYAVKSAPAPDPWPQPAVLEQLSGVLADPTLGIVALRTLLTRYRVERVKEVAVADRASFVEDLDAILPSLQG